jgi:outer membrane usher protein FimD/PapC
VERLASTTGSVTAGYNFDIGRWKNLGITVSWSKTHYEDETTIRSSISH